MSTDRKWYYHHEHIVKQLMGVPENWQGHMPPEFTRHPRDIGGVMVHISKSNKGPDGKSRFGHRVRCHCPCCDREMSYGRIHQHMAVHGVHMRFRYSPVNED